MDNALLKKGLNIPYKKGGASIANCYYSRLMLDENAGYIIFGTGFIGKSYYNKMKKKFNVIGFSSSFNIESKLGLHVWSVDELVLKKSEYDFIIFASESQVEIGNILMEKGIEKEKILFSYL